MMDQSFHYLLMITQALFQKRLYNEFNQKGLTVGQPKILDYLGRHNGCVQKSIADGCQIEPATLTGILNRMEEKGMIERRMLNGNRRSCLPVLPRKNNRRYKPPYTNFAAA